MKRRFLLLVPLLCCSPAGALERALPLERTLGKSPGEPPDFSAAATTTIQYYNLCTGSVWYWSGPPPNATYGVRYDDAPDPPFLRSHFYYAHGAPAGYGYTSLVTVLPFWEERCPDISLYAVAWFTPATGWNTIEWNGGQGVEVDERFFVLVTHSPTPGDPSVLVTEKGSPGGARPGGCGTCYESDRTMHSMQFGADEAILCPGAPWWDGSGCALELLWRADFGFGTVSIESESWGKVKALYR